VSLFDSLDVEGVDLAEAREDPGLASVAANGGKLHVGDGESPTVIRYAGGTSWTKEGLVDSPDMKLRGIRRDRLG
jgi:hypothetical protein